MISFKGILEAAKHSRWYSSDMTVFSCLACFLYALGADGNVLNGLLAFAGILFAHMATNLYDDFDDYKVLSKDPRFDEFAPDVKCAYLRNGTTTMADLFCVVVIYCVLALLIGGFLFIRCGWPVLALAALGGIIVLSYPKFSRAGLSEIAVGIAFGPLLFEGMYFVMTKSFSLNVFILSLAISMFTIGVMYVHTILDFEGDRVAGKKTLVQRLGSKSLAMKGFVFVYALGYLFLTLFAFMSQIYFCLGAFLTIPFVVMLYKALQAYNAETHYSRNPDYLNVLTGAAKTMAVFAFFISIGLFVNLMAAKVI